MSAQNPKPIGVLGAFLGLIGFSALAGVLVTAMVTPAIAVTSVTANSAVSVFDDLPEYVDFGQLSQRNTLWANRGDSVEAFATVYDENREEVGWDSVSQFAKDAAIAGEDERFFEHGGVDIAGIARAAVNNVTNGSTQGASTITQQLVKNLLIVEAMKITDEDERRVAVAEAQAPDLERKLREAKYAIGLEKERTKQEILLGYLNVAGFGGNTYGIEAASQLYYSTTAADLTLAQAASLVAIVQNPNALNLSYSENWQGNESRRNAILGNMLRLGMVDQAQYDEAIATPVDDSTVLLQSPRNGCQNATAAQQFCDYVLRNIKNLASLGATEEERLANWKLGGYDVYTTIDLDQQAHAETVLNDRAPRSETRFELGAAFSTVQAGTGQIRVMAQNKGYINEVSDDPELTSINFNTDYEYGGSTGFQVGSAAKLFTLVNWLENGHGLSEVVNGSAPRNVTIPLGDCTPTLQTGEPERNARFVNDSGGSFGRLTVTRATTLSVNSAFADMASKLSACGIRATAESMGVHRADGDELKLNSTMILGTDEIAPLTMANAYATVAANGVLCDPIAVDRVVDLNGTELPGQEANCRQAITPEVAAATATALETVMAGGGTGQNANPRDGTPLIGKTGTADARSTFLAASSTQLASAVWVGNIRGLQNLRLINVNGTNGGQLRFGIMQNILRELDQSRYNEGATDFPEAPANLVRGSSQPVPNIVGQTVGQARGLVQSLGLDLVEGDTVPSELPAGQIVSTDPGAGAAVSRGTTITARVSDGSLAATMPNVVGQQLRDASNAILGAGMTGGISVNYVAGNDDARCTVTASDPGGGANTSRTANVTLTVNGGADPGSSRCT